MQNCNSISGFCRDHRRELLFTVLAVLLCWQHNAFTQNVRVDTEVFIANPGTLQGWLQIGRPSLLPLKYILGNLIYNPYYGGFLFLVFFTLLTAGWMYLLHLCSGGKGRLAVFAALFVSCQTWAYMFYFNMMAAEIAAAMLFEIAALTLFTKIPLEKNLKSEGKRFLAVLLLIFAFGCFQALVPLFISGAAICILLQLDAAADRGDAPSFKEYAGLALTYVVPFAAAFTVYWLVNRRFFLSDSAYFAAVNQWLSKPEPECAADIRRVVLESFGGSPYEYSPAFLLGSLGTLGFLLRDLIKGRHKGRVWMYTLTLAVFFAAPFVIAVYFGGYFIARMQFCLQSAGAFLCWYTLTRLPAGGGRSARVCRIAASAAVCVLAVFQFSVIQRLMYTDDVRQKQDERVAADVVRDIEEQFGQTGLPVVFTGSRPCPLNGLCLTVDEMFGRSVLCWSYRPDSPTDITGRAAGFIESVYGIEYTPPTHEQCLAAAQAAAGKPCYPQEGYVFEDGGVIIVKLGE